MYWPETCHEPIYFGDLIVEMESESAMNDYTLRVMSMKLVKTFVAIAEHHILSPKCFNISSF